MNVAEEWRAPSTRLIVAPVAHDETLSSVLDRAAAQYGIGAMEVLGALIPDAPGRGKEGGYDDLTDATLRALAVAMGTRFEALKQARLPNAEHLLRPDCRVAYCPICFKHDLGAGRVPYFRKDWASLFALTCAADGAPLFAWSAVTPFGTRKLPLPSERRGHRSILNQEAIRFSTKIAQRTLADQGLDSTLLRATAEFARTFGRALFDLSLGRRHGI